MNSDSITVTHLEAENLFRFDRFALDPQKLTICRGANDQGKTSVLRILNFIAKGSDNPAAVIRDGATKGFGTLTFSNGYTLERSATSTGEKGRQYVKLRDERGHEVPNPQKTIDAWLGEMADFNPLRWIDLATSDSVEDRRRALRMLLQAVDVRFTAAEFTAAVGMPAPDGVDFSAHALEVIEALKAHYSDERKYENRIVSEKKAAANEARAILPGTRPVISAERLAEVTAAATRASEAKTSFETRRLAATSHEQAVAHVRDAQARERSSIVALDADVVEVETQIQRLQDSIQRKRDEQSTCRARIEQGDRDIEALASSAPPTEEERAQVNALLRSAREIKESIDKDQKTIAIFVDVDSREQEANDASVQAAILTDIIKQIDGEFRATIMQKVALPVDALTIENGRILIDGHPIENIAESQQIRVALAIARSLNPKLRMIALDGTERLDANTFLNVFLPEIHNDGFQYVAAEVDRDGGPMRVVVFGETEVGVVEQQEAVA